MKKNMVGILSLTGALTLGGGVMAPIAEQFFASASAADVSSTNVTGSKSIADGSHVYIARGGFNVTLNWSIPNGTKANDTTHITLNNKIKGSVITNGQIKTDAGEVIGNVNGSGVNYTVTYTDFVETHTNISASIKLSVDGNPDNWGPSGSLQTIDATVDGSKVDLGNFIYDYAVSAKWGITGALQPNGSSPTPALIQKLSPDQFVDGDAGKTFNWVATIDKEDQPYAVYDCGAMLASGYGMNYALFGPDGDTGDRRYSGSGNSNGSASLVDPYFKGSKYDFSATANPFKVKLVSCTPEKVVYEYTVPKEAVGMQAQFNVPINLTSKAVAEQFVGPYNGGVDVYAKDDGVPNPNGFGYGMWTNYTFTDGQGSGTVAPKAADDTVTTKANTKINIKVLENDTLGKGVKEWKSVELKDSNGKAVDTLKTVDGEYTVVGGKTVDFTPSKDFVGKIKEPPTYIATDENNLKDEAKINITVEAAPEPTAPEPTTPEPSTPEPTTPEPTTPSPVTTTPAPVTTTPPPVTTTPPAITETVTPPPVVETTTPPAVVVTSEPVTVTPKPVTVVGPTVQTDYVSSNNANDIAGVVGLAAIMGLGAM